MNSSSSQVSPGTLALKALQSMGYMQMIDASERLGVVAIIERETRTDLAQAVVSLEREIEEMAKALEEICNTRGGGRSEYDARRIAHVALAAYKETTK